MPQEILYENMKPVVISRRGKPISRNSEFAHVAHHYQFHPERCPPYSPWVKGKVERPMHSIRERCWRGDAFDSLARANRDLVIWLNATAHQRIHGPHRQSMPPRWQQEWDQLGRGSEVPYDTSLKVVRKVYKDGQVTYNGKRYVGPYHVVGKKVLLKLQAGTIRFYDDQELLVT